MPAYARTRRFERDWKRLETTDRDRFHTAFTTFDADLAAGTFRPGLRVKRVEATDAIFEMTWAPDGQATFEYGSGGDEGAHVIWRRIGRHAVLNRR